MPPPRAKVAIVSTYYPPVIGGAEAAASRLATFLDRRGNQVFVLTRRTSRDVPGEDVVDGVPVSRLPPIGERSALGKWRFTPRVLVALWRRRRDYDVIAVIDHRATAFGAMAIRVAIGRPVVLQPHTEGGLGRSHPSYRGARAIVRGVVTWPIRWCYQFVDGVACITQSILREGREIGIPERRLHYIPNPVDTTLFAPADAAARQRARAEFDLPADGLIFVYTGRLSREKGVRELLTAWRDFRGDGATLAVIGPDMPGHPWDEGPWVREFIRTERLSTRVRLMGPQHHDDVARLLPCADVAVLPSHFELLPLAALEAMACGIPVIATRVGGVPDFLQDDVNGLLVPPKNPGALTQAFARAAGDRGRRERWGRAAREAAEAFSAAVVLERFGALLDRLGTAGR